MLCSGCLENIKLAGRMLECGVGATAVATATEEDSAVEPRTEVFKRRVAHEQAIDLVLCAAREYFDASATMNDPDMDLARSAATFTAVYMF